MNRAFLNGISGSKSYQYGIDTWANNIANINTNGYKANIPQFADLFSDKVAAIENARSPVSSDQGFGVRANDSAISLSQGALEITDRPMDLAILGEGWFGLQGDTGQVTQYTRNGNFHFNRDGDIVNADGGYLMGTLSDQLLEGKIDDIIESMPLADIGAQRPMKLPQKLTLGAIATQNVSLHGNIGIEAVPQKFNAEIYTKEGEKRTLLIEIEKDATQVDGETKWTLRAHIEDAKGKRLFEATPTPLLFDGSGIVKDFTPPKIDNDGTPIKLSLGGGSFGGLVSLASDSTSKNIVKDGVAKGDLLQYDIDRDGHLVANFNNGRSSVIGKIALYHFQNDQGLTKLGQNHFTSSSNSGNAIFYTNEKGENILGSSIMPSALEKSNTSAATALTELIILQRAFDANAKSITTGDQLIQAALRMLN